MRAGYTTKHSAPVDAVSREIIAKFGDKMAVIRSVVSVDEHSDSMVMTGYSQAVNRTATRACPEASGSPYSTVFVSSSTRGSATSATASCAFCKRL